MVTELEQKQEELAVISKSLYCYMTGLSSKTLHFSKID